MVNHLARIRIVDDDPDMRRSWVFMLQSAGWLVSSYESAQEFLEKDDPSEIGCLLLDVRMPNMSGLELQELLNEEKNGLPIVFCSAHGSIDMAVYALKQGAIDFLEKPVDGERLLHAIEQAVAKDQARRDKALQNQEAMKRFENLTTREQEVASALAKGLSNRDVGLQLGIAEKTVQIHRGALCKKLGVHSAVEIARLLDTVKATQSL